MNDERKYEQMLDQFIDAMNAGEVPPIDLLTGDEQALSELLPLLDFVAWFKVSNTDVIEEDKAAIKDAILQQVADHDQWSMHHLIALSEAETVVKASQAGLTHQQVKQLSNDSTPIDINRPNDVVHYLSEQYGIKFFNLLGWVRQLISDVLSAAPNNNPSPAFTREAKRQSESGNKEASQR